LADTKPLLNYYPSDSFDATADQIAFQKKFDVLASLTLPSIVGISQGYKI